MLGSPAPLLPRRIDDDLSVKGIPRREDQLDGPGQANDPNRDGDQLPSATERLMSWRR
jgi:hypothetical protein